MGTYIRYPLPWHLEVTRDETHLGSIWVNSLTALLIGILLVCKGQCGSDIHLASFRVWPPVSQCSLSPAKESKLRNLTLTPYCLNVDKGVTISSTSESRNLDHLHGMSSCLTPLPGRSIWPPELSASSQDQPLGVMCSSILKRSYCPPST